MARPPRIFLSAGEASGDRLGAGLARELLRRRPDVQLIGMGGPAMAREGVRLLQDSAEVSVVGIFEVLAHLREIRAAMRRLEQSIRAEPPDLLVPVDFPDFNLRLARRARSSGVEVVYFVSPQVWAWRRGRVKLIRRIVRRMLVLFPFETSFYERAGVPVSFVGHPLAEYVEPDEERESLCVRAGLDSTRPVVALLPGSRRSEVGRLLPPMLDGLALVRRRHPSVQGLVSLAPGLEREWVASRIEQAGVTDVALHAGDFPQILTVCDACAVASGTASLEAAVAGVPLVVVYRMSPLSYAVGRMLVRLEHVGMPNLVAGRRVVPELIQGECTGERIGGELLRYLDAPAEAERVRGELRRIRSRLGGPGIFERAAEQVLEELPDATR